MPSNSYLFVLAHPDDDVFISGHIQRFLADELEVHCVWLTSGGYMGGAMKRERELFAVAEILGLRRSQIHLMRLADLGLIGLLETVIQYLIRLFEAVEPKAVYVNAFEGGHPDHDCASFAVFEARRRSGCSFEILEFPLYNGAGSFRQWRWQINTFPNGDGIAQYLPLTFQEVATKHRTMRIYASQWMYMIPARLACSTKKMVREGEPKRLCHPDRDHTVKPHSGKLNYERWFNSFMRIKFSNYQEAVKRSRLA